jgi:hypothetical protein
MKLLLSMVKTENLTSRGDAENAENSKSENRWNHEEHEGTPRKSITGANLIVRFLINPS